MASFDEVMARTPSENRTAREKREEIVQQIIQDVEQQSVALSLGEVTRMSTFKTRFRVANTVPDAFWVNGTTGAGDAPYGSNNNDDTNQVAKDSGLKQTSNMTWDYIERTPDEIAVLIPMPDSWRDDSDLAWDEIRSGVRSAFALAIDKAIFWGASTTSHPLPSTFGNGIVADTLASGNVVVEGTGVDPADDYALLFQSLEERGFTATGAVVNNSETWRLRRLRSGGPEGMPIYQSLDAAGNGLIYGRALTEVRNGTWEPTFATALTGEWSNLKIGVRQDIEFKMFDQGVITDANGNITFNSMQNDGEILRACMRLAYVVTDPYRYATGQREYPFEMLAPVGYSS